MKLNFQIRAWIIACAVTLLFPLSTTATTISDKDIKQLKENVIGFFTTDEYFAENIELAKNAISTIEQDGSWASIPYDIRHKVAGGWLPRNHHENLLAIAAVYQKEGSPYYHNADVAKKYLAALRYWIKVQPKSNNWWDGHIGTPQDIAPSVILMEKVMSEEDFAGIKSTLYYSKLDDKKIGQNRIWIAGNILYRGIIYNDVEEVKYGSDIVKEGIAVNTNNEGIQSDFSFHQHGPQHQFGNYGLHFMQDMAQWGTIFNNSAIAFSDEQIKIIRDYTLQGVRWVIWNDAFDMSTCGRQIYPNSPNTKFTSLNFCISMIAKIDPEYRSEYQKIDDYLKFTGHKHFWCSDFQVKRTTDYYLSIKMCSSRVAGSEAWGSENRRGYHSSDGSLMLYQSGDEYKDIAPFWNWRKIPGNTVAQGNGPYIPNESWLGYHIESEFVGGVSNGENGVAAMRYIRDGINADKSWFVINDLIFCLGSSISSTAEPEITTSVNQIHSVGEIHTSKGKMSGTKLSGDNISWAWHSNTGYLFPSGGDVNITNQKVEGSWYDINTTLPKDKIQADIFSIWLSHGVKPKAQRYSYIMVPNASIDKTTKLSKELPYKITNNKDIQIVEALDGSIGGAVCYTAQSVDLMGGIELSEPAVMIYKRDKGQTILTISEPTRKLKSLTISFDSTQNVFDASGDTLGVIKGKKRVIDLKLPEVGFAGAPIKLIVK